MEEVIVVGAGPAGLACVKGLVNRGIKPLVFQREDFGRKVCGDLVVAKWFDYPIAPYLNPEAVEREFSYFTINFYGKNHILDGKWLSIDRAKFERSLYENAKKGGASFRFEPVTRIERKGNGFLINGQVETKILVGADGVNSVVRSFLGQEVEKVFAIRGYAETDLENPTMYIDKKIIRGGYAWAFPKRDVVNIGVGGKRIKDVKVGWEKFSKGLEVKDVRGWFIPCSMPCKTEFKNVLLIGDAASQIESFTCGGINASLVCGEFAAEAIANSKSYEKLWKKELYLKLLVFYLKGKTFWSFLMDHSWAEYLLRWFF